MSLAAESARLAAAIQRGAPLPLGATPGAAGTNFVLASGAAERVELCLFAADTGALRGSVDLPARSGERWHGFLPAACAAVGDLYAYRVHGSYAPDRGLRCNPAKLLLDPAARAVSGEPASAPSLYDGPDTRSLDSAPAMPRGRIVDARFAWDGDRPPATPWTDTVLYELHVRGFTQRHPGVPERLRGTYLGLAEPAAVDWLRALGVTAVELMPCQAFTSEDFLRARALTNYWGYNPIAWSAPATQYALADPVAEFQTRVKALHRAGLEVILDVVFNHTAEGDERGPTLSLRGIDNASYYQLSGEDPRRYANWTGTGNTVAVDHPPVTELVIDCLRWWVEAMHVDGFRFDLAPVLGRKHPAFNRHADFFNALGAEPALAGIKLIAEPWDVGPVGYQLGQFPAGWSEWNDRYRDTARAFWRGDAALQGELAERLAGSSDLFRQRDRSPSASINFITAHDGFSLADLVSYNERHNLANLEANADGHAHNLSWNCGVEGPTDDPAVTTLRNRQLRNFLLTLLVSQGVPMLQAGDEIARTQAGNNNAYCQDNALSWLDWSQLAAQRDLTEFVSRLLAIRRRRPELRRARFLSGAADAGSAGDVHWLHPAGREMTGPDWQDGALRALGMRLVADEGSSAGDVLVLLNAAAQPCEFALPRVAAGAAWTCRLDTAGPAEPAPAAGTRVARLEAHSAMLLEVDAGVAGG